MARIRSMKPEFRRSRTVTAWSRDVRLTWALLWGYLDDQGRGEDDTQLLKADLFPRDRDVTERKLDGWLWEIAECKRDAPLCRYTVDGRDYLHATNWQEHQRINRPSASRLPPCPSHDDGMSGHVRNRDASRTTHGKRSEDSVSPHRASTEGSPPSRAPAEQGAGSRGAEEQGFLTARDVIAEWIERQKQRPPERVVGQAAREVASLLDEGFQPPVVAAALDAMSEKRTHPSTLPSLVHGLVNGGGGTKPATGTQRALAARSIGDRLREAGQ